MISILMAEGSCRVPQGLGFRGVLRAFLTFTDLHRVPHGA